MARTFESLVVWQKARSLNKRIKLELDKIPASKTDYDLNRQIKRASNSVMSNIAEGSSRGTKADYARFIDMASGSSSEIRSHLYAYLDYEILEPSVVKELQAKSIEINKMLTGLKKTLKNAK
ncbi:four helix bundle protein [Sanyastnella coralliicola]|uniref:four helix bundle protein n=1 Tax=Sanyastnella coralliicola TaxID=3069118 RepID=UPI0027BB16C0|nr:four helix bundle protein [Longitalea sp. SCSIO 12813]